MRSKPHLFEAHVVISIFKSTVLGVLEKTCVSTFVLFSFLFFFFSNESTLRMRWPKYWSFSFSIIPSREIPGLISFRMDWLDLQLDYEEG